METRFCFRVIFLLIFVLSFFHFASARIPFVQLSDTSGTDSTGQLPDFYRGVDVKIIYSWNPEEPDLFQNVSCQLIKKNQVIEEIKIIRSDCTDRITFKPEYMSFEVRDRKTARVVVKGP